MTTRVRSATPEDAKDIARIHAHSWRTAYRGLLPQRYLDAMSPFVLTVRWQKRLRWDSTRPDRGEQDILVVEHEGQVAGFTEIGPCVDDSDLIGFAGEVNMLYVEPDLVGRGLGRRMLDHGLRVLGEREFYWVVIWVLEANEPARRFYESAGLRWDTAVREDRFVNERVSVVRYAKALNPIVDFTALAGGSAVKSG